MSTQNTPTALTVAEAAARLGVDPKTVRRAIARGDLSARRIGPRLLRISQDDLDSYGNQVGVPKPDTRKVAMGAWGVSQTRRDTQGLPGETRRIIRDAYAEGYIAGMERTR